MSMFEDQIKAGSDQLRSDGLIGANVEVFMPEVETHQAIDAPLTGMAKLFGLIGLILMIVPFLFILASLGFMIYDFGTGRSADSYLVTKIFAAVFWIFGTFIVAGILVGVVYVVNWIIGPFFKRSIRQRFVNVVEGVFDSSPELYLEKGASIDSYAFYGLDTQTRKLFFYGSETGWRVVCLPLQMVQRYEHLRDTETTVTTTQKKFGGVTSQASSRSEHSLRFHAIEVNGTASQYLIPFGSDESHLQSWITSLNAV